MLNLAAGGAAKSGTVFWPRIGAVMFKAETRRLALRLVLEEGMTPLEAAEWMRAWRAGTVGELGAALAWRVAAGQDRGGARVASGSSLRTGC